MNYIESHELYEFGKDILNSGHIEFWIGVSDRTDEGQ